MSFEFMGDPYAAQLRAAKAEGELAAIMDALRDFAEECGDDYDNVPTFRVVAGCRGCHEEGCDSTYDDEPCFGIEAYYRADHPLIRDEEDPEDCERVLERYMAERWNRRDGRTCRMIFLWSEFEDGECYKCSACDGIAFTHGGTPSYCPNCGARVEP